MSTVKLRYPIYCPLDFVAHDWGIAPATKNLQVVLDNPYRIAALPVMFNESHMWCYNAVLAQLDLSQFDLIILSDIEFESVANIQAWISQNQIKKYVLATGGQIANDIFDSTCMVYRPWWSYNLLKFNEYQDTAADQKPFLFDALVKAW